MTSADAGLPRGGCDAHVHVFGDPAVYPLSTQRRYTPGTAAREDLERHLETLGLDRVVVVQPSPYGTDNRCLVDVLRALGVRARGVAVLASDVTQAELLDLHDAGVRGLRVNLYSFARTDPSEAAVLLRESAATAAALGWHVQLFAELGTIAALEHEIRDLPGDLVVDHFGCVPALAETDDPAMRTLLALVAEAGVFVKLSGTDRLTTHVESEGVEHLARALIDAGPTRMLWGSDWPHTPKGNDPSEAEVDAFREVDDTAALRRLRRWAGDDEHLRAILVDNPARLYGF